MAEWFKALAWKVSYGQPYAGSNPVLSALDFIQDTSAV